MANNLRDALVQAGLQPRDGKAAGDQGGHGDRNDRRDRGDRGGQGRGSGGGPGNPVPDEQRFHNPYHFVPVPEPDMGRWIEREQFETLAGAGQGTPQARLSHASYLDQDQDQKQDQGHHSGRLLCRLEAEGPFCVGARRTQDATSTSLAVVVPFELERDTPAIPASSLRGLISSLAEAASGSALRVLNPGLLTYRREMGDGLSALGMIVGEGPDFCLLPLTLPTLEGSPEEGYRHWDSTPEPQRWRALRCMFPTPRLKAYVGYYGGHGQEGAVLHRASTKTFSPEGGKYHHLRLAKEDWAWTGDKLGFDPALRTKSKGRGRDQIPDWFVIGQKADAVPNTQTTPGTTRGILRVLGTADRDDIPHTKKHEVFIPCPEGAELGPSFRILPEAIRRFHELADERADATWARVKDDPAAEHKVHPFHPLETRAQGERRRLDGRLVLKPGDIVYFNARMQGTEAVVDEVSFSAIWRGRVEDAAGQRADMHSFFGAIDPELLPFNQHRQWVSPAEQIFGFVQGDASADGGGLAYASRVRFSAGRLAKGQQGPYYDKPVTLKVLDSPKPPSPALYFKPQGGKGYVRKKDLSPDRHRPLGRKLYLHHPAALKGQRPWETLDPEENTKQKVRIRPISQGKVFYFHLDFTNFNAWELGLLCFALRPEDTFRHKLGMGKPLGLGTVRIDPVGLFLLDRRARYETDDPFGAARYHQAEVDAGTLAEWPEDYSAERQAQGASAARSWALFRQDFAATVDADVRQALSLLGNPDKVRYPVHTPQVYQVFGPRMAPRDTVAGAAMESETFRWFVANDRGSGNSRKQNKRDAMRKPLESLDATSTELPWLERYDWSEV